MPRIIHESFDIEGTTITLRGGDADGKEVDGSNWAMDETKEFSGSLYVRISIDSATYSEDA
jgi:hypothetical protein